jgi:hypothetical protein
LIHGSYASSTWKEAAHEHKKSKLAEMDLAVVGVLRMVEQACEGVPIQNRKVLFVLGNGKFKTGFNMTSLHTTFLRWLFQKVNTHEFGSIRALSASACILITLVMIGAGAGLQGCHCRRVLDFNHVSDLHPEEHQHPLGKAYNEDMRLH